jgi:hypothetical protein
MPNNGIGASALAVATAPSDTPDYHLVRRGAVWPRMAYRVVSFWLPLARRYVLACRGALGRPDFRCRARPAAVIVVDFFQWLDRSGPLLTRSGGKPRRIALCGKGLACPLRGDGVEASTVAVEHRWLAGKVLPSASPQHRHKPARSQSRGRRGRSSQPRLSSCPSR